MRGQAALESDSQIRKQIDEWVAGFKKSNEMPQSPYEAAVLFYVLNREHRSLSFAERVKVDPDDALVSHRLKGFLAEETANLLNEANNLCLVVDLGEELETSRDEVERATARYLEISKKLNFRCDLDYFSCSQDPPDFFYVKDPAAFEGKDSVAVTLWPQPSLQTVYKGTLTYAENWKSLENQSGDLQQDIVLL